jgi:hypothetical protein
MLETRRLLTLLTGALLIAAPRAAAQEPAPRHVAAVVGLFQYDLSGTGLAPMLALRGTTPVSSVITLEAGVLAARPRQQFGETTTFLAPELQAQLALPFTSILPYMGLGLGGALGFRSSAAGGRTNEISLSGSLGIRGQVWDRYGLQAEFRGRGIGLDFAGSSAEYTVGVTRRI